MEKNKIRRIGLYTIIILVIIRFVYLPIDNSLKGYKDALEEKIENYRLKESSYQNLLSKLSQTEKKEDRTLSKIVYHSDVSDAYIQTKLLEFSQQIIKKTKLELLTFEFPSSLEKEGVREISILLRIKGSPKDMFSFMESCKDFEKLVVIKSFENTRLSDADINMFFKVKLSTYKLNKGEE